MVTLFASIMGFFSSFFPECLKIFKDKNDKKHELAILDRQIELQKAGHIMRQEEIEVYAEVQENRILHDNFKVGISWVDALSGSVRPVLAYAFFILYGLIKLLQYVMIEEKAPLSYYLDILWTSEDQAIFAGIISFYFGQRTIAKLRK